MNHLCQQCHCQVEKVSSRAEGWWWKHSFEKLQSSFCFVFVFVFCRVVILPLNFYFLNSTICFPHHIHVFRYFFPYLVFLLGGDVICQLWTNYINILRILSVMRDISLIEKFGFLFLSASVSTSITSFSAIFLSSTFFLHAKWKWCVPNIRKNWFILFKLSLIQDQLIEG